MNDMDGITSDNDVDCSNCWHQFNTYKHKQCPFCGGNPKFNFEEKGQIKSAVDWLWDKISGGRDDEA